MTDEEKAEEYRKANYDLVSEPLMELVERCYLDGLDEGREGIEKLYRVLDQLRESKNRKQKKIKVLQEGEAARFESWNNKLTELEKENAELEKENAELKKQIEQMKRCKNCKQFPL